VFTPVGTAGAADYYDITGVQVEPTSAPSDHEFRDFGEELRRCQRYYYRIQANATNLNVHMALGVTYGTTRSLVTVALPVTMRTAPSLASWSGLRVYDGQASTAASLVVIDVNYNSSFAAALDITQSALGGSFRPALLQANGVATGHVGISAEL
jgi:hypothetical protein